MKKTIAMLLALVLLLGALAGCSSKQTQQEAALEQVDASGIENFVRGVVGEDNVYRNEFAALALQMPDGWMPATDEQLAQVSGMTADFYNDKEFYSELASRTTVLDFYCYDPQTGENINVTYENLLAYNNEEYLNMTREEYKDLAIQAIGAQTNMQPTERSSEVVTLGGEEYLKTVIDIYYPEMDATGTIYDYFRIVDGFVVIISGQREVDSYIIDYGA